METIDFAYNWNNKLDCKAFTTIRLSGRKYAVGQEYNIKLKGEAKGKAVCVDIKRFTLDHLNEFIALLDTGYDKAECTALIKNMYRYKNIQWEEQVLFLVLLKYITT